MSIIVGDRVNVMHENQRDGGRVKIATGVVKGITRVNGEIISVRVVGTIFVTGKKYSGTLNMPPHKIEVIE